MKIFFKKLTLFLLLSILILGSVFLFLDYTIHQELDNYKNNSKMNTLFIGDSRVQMAINDSLLTKSINLSKELESLNYTFLKIKTLVNTSCNIKQIYLGVSYGSLSNFNDKFIDGNFSTEIYARYFFILSTEDKIKLFKENSGNIFSLTSCILTNGFKEVLNTNKKLSYFGSYQNNYIDTAIESKSVKLQINNQFFDKGLIRDFSKKNIMYLEQIIQFCNSRKVKLIILNTPLHPLYYSLVPNLYKNKYEDLINRNNVKYLNTSKLISNDSLFASDGQHVNRKGAYTTTKFINSKLIQ